MLSRAVLVPLSPLKGFICFSIMSSSYPQNWLSIEWSLCGCTDLSLFLVTLNKLHGILSAEIRERSYGVFITGSY